MKATPIVWQVKLTLRQSRNAIHRMGAGFAGVEVAEVIVILITKTSIGFTATAAGPFSNYALAHDGLHFVYLDGVVDMPVFLSVAAAMRAIKKAAA